MAKKSLLDSIDVPAPCPKKWDEMIGDEKVRLCQSCDKQIYNISEMTRGEARKLLFQSKEKVCIRLEKDRDGKVQTIKKQFHKITRQAPIAAGVLTASLTFSALTYAQGDAVIGTTSATISGKHTDKISNASVSGVVTDYASAVIPSGIITLRDTRTDTTRTTKSNDDGFYEFKNVEKSIYKIEAEWTGFKKSVSADFTVENGASLRVNIILQPSAPPTDQDMIFDDSRVITTKPPQIVDKVETQKPESLPAQKHSPVIGLFPGTKPAPVKKAANKSQNKTSQISFTFYDPMGAVVPNETVKLTNQKTKEEFIVSSNQQGVAQFSLIPRGRYDVLTTSSIGFQNHSQIVEIKEAIEPNIKIYLDVAGASVGVVVINASEIPLFQAISQKDNEAVRQLINSGFDVNTKDSRNKTALHVAVEYDNLEIVRLLLDRNAKVNVKSKDKRTPLLMIDETVRDEEDESVVEIVRLLIAEGADLNVQDDEGETALMMAGDGNSEVVKILLEAGANPNLKDKDGDTVLSMTSDDEIKQLLKRYGARE